MIDTQHKEEWKLLWERIDRQEKVPAKQVLFSDIREIKEETEHLLSITQTTSDTIEAYKRLMQELPELYILRYGPEQFEWTQKEITALNNIKFFVHIMWDWENHANRFKKDDDFSFEAYPTSPVNCPKSIRQQTHEDRYFFFHRYLEKNNPELARMFQNFYHDLNTDSVFVGHACSDFDANHVKEAWRNSLISNKDAAWIFWTIHEWAHLELLHTKPKDDSEVKELHNSFSAAVDACRALNAGDDDINVERLNSDELTISVHGHGYGHKVKEWFDRLKKGAETNERLFVDE